MKRNPLKYLPIINISHIQQLPSADNTLAIRAYTLALRALFSALPSYSLDHTHSLCACDVPGTVLEK